MTLPKKPFDLLNVFFPFLCRKSASEEGLDITQKLLGYRFRDPSLLTHALTHKSYVSSTDDREGLLSNERMEFLGDSVLNCLVTEYLYQRFTDKAEGHLSKMKSLIVSRKILGEVAFALVLGDHLLLGSSESRSGGSRRISILSNAFEAIVGAIYLDGGMEPSRTFLQKHLFPRIDEFLSDKRHVNYKSTILEMAQRDGLGIPRYNVVETSGPEHAKKFTVEVEVAGVPLGKGYGSNKKTAQQNAAHKALSKYSKNDILTRSQGVVVHELVSDRRTADDSGHSTGSGAQEDPAGP